MNTQVVGNTEAYIVTDTVANESWMLAGVEFCNGTFCIIRGRETRLYKTRRGFSQAWQGIMHTINLNGWEKVIA